MVDRVARDRAAALVVELRGNLLTVDKLSEQWPASEDRALDQIYDALCRGGAKDDVSMSELRRAPTAHENDMLERCALFLQTDLEYTWPERNMFAQLFWGLLITVIFFVGFIVCWGEGLLPFILAQALFGGLWVASMYVLRRAAVWKQKQSSGDAGAWPFPRRAEYERVLRNRLEFL